MATSQQQQQVAYAPDGRDVGYLRQHSIGPIVDALLQDVLLAQPDGNPYVWMADQLRYLREMRIAGSGSVGGGGSGAGVSDDHR